MPHLRNTWYVAAWSDELQGSKPIGMKIIGDRIVVYRTESGELVALEDRCVHRLAPLSLGRCEGERLRCMYHGILFDPDGAVSEIPGQDIVPSNARVRAYPVVERHGWIWIWMGDPAKADATSIPSIIGIDHPDWLLGHGHLDYASSAQLITENLLDFSHLAYVHAESFGIGTLMAETHAKISPIDRGIRYVRWMEALPVNNAGQPDEPLDSYLSYDYLVPGILMLRVGCFPLGTAKALDFGVPDMDRAVRDVSFSGQAVTPMDEKTTRYFFTFGTHRRFDAEKLVGPMMAVVEKAFAEDKVMIEAQQQVIDDTPRPTMIPTSHDRSITLYNRMIDKLIRDESAEAVAA